MHVRRPSMGALPIFTFDLFAEMFSISTIR